MTSPKQTAEDIEAELNGYMAKLDALQAAWRALQEATDAEGQERLAVALKNAIFAMKEKMALLNQSNRIIRRIRDLAAGGLSTNSQELRDVMEPTDEDRRLVLADTCGEWKSTTYYGAYFRIDDDEIALLEDLGRRERELPLHMEEATPAMLRLQEMGFVESNPEYKLWRVSREGRKYLEGHQRRMASPEKAPK